MPLPIPQYRNSFFSIFLFAALTTYLVFAGKANMFFLIYIFWWDEFIKTIFAAANRFFRATLIEDVKTFSRLLMERFFMLFIYFIFIVVIFGIIQGFSTGNKENGILTLEILFFMNWGFNATLLLILLREIFNYKFGDIAKITTENLSFGALIVLHVSIILGALLWTFASGKFKIFDGVGENADKFIILPFILIKFFFDWMNLKSESK